MSPPVVSAEVVGRYAKHGLVEAGAAAVDQFIARLLARAHDATMAIGDPAEARGILRVAWSFSDELATTVSGFDRLAFLGAVSWRESDLDEQS